MKRKPNHVVVCPHCGEEIPCLRSEAAPSAYQAHRLGDCPDPSARETGLQRAAVVQSSQSS